MLKKKFLQWIASHRQSHYSDVDFTRVRFQRIRLHPGATSTPFFKRLARTFPDFVRDLKLELINNGRPTLHLVVMGVPFLARQWLSRAWYQIVGSDDPRHPELGPKSSAGSPLSQSSVMLRSTLRRFHVRTTFQHVRALLGHRWTKYLHSRESSVAASTVETCAIICVIREVWL